MSDLNSIDSRKHTEQIYNTKRDNKASKKSTKYHWKRNKSATESTHGMFAPTQKKQWPNNPKLNAQTVNECPPKHTNKHVHDRTDKTDDSGRKKAPTNVRKSVASMFKQVKKQQSKNQAITRHQHQQKQ